MKRFLKLIFCMLMLPGIARSMEEDTDDETKNKPVIIQISDDTKNDSNSENTETPKKPWFSETTKRHLRKAGYYGAVIFCESLPYLYVIQDWTARTVFATSGCNAEFKEKMSNQCIEKFRAADDSRYLSAYSLVQIKIAYDGLRLVKWWAG